MIYLLFRKYLEVNAKKASCFDKIPSKLVKLAAPLSKTINSSISKGVLPNEAKIALVIKNTRQKFYFKLLAG